MEPTAALDFVDPHDPCFEKMPRELLAAECARLSYELGKYRDRFKGMLALMSLSTRLGISSEISADSVADELEHALLADAAIFYLASERGFVPFGVSGGFRAIAGDLDSLSSSLGVPPLVSRKRKTTCLNLVEPATEAGGACVMRDVSGARYKLVSLLAGQCSTIVGTPVFSGDKVSAVLVCGWRSLHELEPEELETLDMISEMLTFGFASAFNNIVLQRSNDFKDALREVGTVLSNKSSVDLESARQILGIVCDAMLAHGFIVQERLEGGCDVYPLQPDEWEEGSLPAAFSFDDLPAVREGVAEVVPGSEMGTWLAQRSEALQGFSVRLCPFEQADDPRCVGMVLRNEDDVPFDLSDEEFLRNLVGDISRLVSTEQVHASDAQIARALQVGLRNEIPQVPGISTATLYLSATESAVVGGDFFDLQALSDGRFVVVMGDVSGKGVEAAVAASLAKTGLAAYAWDKAEPHQMVAALNTLFLNFSKVETFATMCVVLVDLASRTATYCSAGHPPAMLVRRPDSSNPELELLTVRSPVVGAFEGLSYTSGHLSFEYGDILFLYTDGTTETRSPSGGFFGEGNLRDALLRACRFGVDDVPRRVLREVERFSSGETHDDIAMVAVRFDGL